MYSIYHLKTKLEIDLHLILFALTIIFISNPTRRYISLYQLQHSHPANIHTCNSIFHSQFLAQHSLPNNIPSYASRRIQKGFPMKTKNNIDLLQSPHIPQLNFPHFTLSRLPHTSFMRKTTRRTKSQIKTSLKMHKATANMKEEKSQRR